MVTSAEVKLHVEQYFGAAWVWHVLRGGQNWGIIPGVNEYMDITIDNKEIRIYPIKTNRELAIRLAVWDYGTDKNRDDMYVRTDEDLAMIPVLLDKFFG
jgi:hypothetical protein